MKKVLVIQTSLRDRSNSDFLAEAFVKGARAAGHEVEVVSLKGKQMAFCRGCMACKKLGHCAIADDAQGVTEKISHADVVAFATPVYYYNMSGQMKTLMDRSNALYPSAYQFRQVYLLATAEEDAPSAVEGTAKGVEGWVSCFSRAVFAGTVFAGGVDAPGSIEGHPALRQAEDLGKAI